MAAWVNAVLVDLERGLRRPNLVTDRLANFLSIDNRKDTRVVTLNLYFFSGIVWMLTICCTVELGSKFLFVLIGILYPTYKLVKIILNKILQKPKDPEVHLAVNWFVFAGFGVFQHFLDIPPALTDVYLFIKNTFLIWYFMWYSYRVFCGQEYMISTTSNSIQLTAENTKQPLESESHSHGLREQNELYKINQ